MESVHQEKRVLLYRSRNKSEGRKIIEKCTNEKSLPSPWIHMRHSNSEFSGNEWCVIISVKCEGGNG